MEFAKESIE